MKTATVADLRNHFRRVAAWIESGKSVLIIKRGKPFARLAPEAGAKPKSGKVDFAARRKAIWGDRVFSDAEVNAMRDAEREDEEASAFPL
jgi:antitoxin (DNA-binding transcriptional repressor) of toxin-antitoxin stability system